MEINMSHDPVLLDEVLRNLNLKAGDVVVDCTLGLGGHSLEMAKVIGKAGVLVGFDCDEEHIKIAQERLRDSGASIIFVRNNFVHLKSELLARGFGKVDAILMDLGIASPHVDDPQRGFSFRQEGPLDMRMDKDLKLTAGDVVNTYEAEKLMKIFWEYGEEKNSKKIAQAIVRRRQEKLFETTKDLADLIASVVHKKERIHPATRIFQALRIEVNGELEVLQTALDDGLEMLKEGGRMGVISYHSLEDRIVKKTFLAASKPVTQETVYSLHHEVAPARFKTITKKPVVPTATELERNSRSRSAKLRVIERI